MPEEKSGESGFKVVDRRTFSADGKRREVDAAPEGNKLEPPTRSPRPSEPQPEADLEAGLQPEFDERGTDFETLVSYLSTTAMFQLGLLAGPSGERIPADLPNARRTINLLEVLQQKTEGNLTPDEEQLLEAALYELRLSFVEAEKGRAKKTR